MKCYDPQENILKIYFKKRLKDTKVKKILHKLHLCKHDQLLEFTEIPLPTLNTL